MSEFHFGSGPGHLPDWQDEIAKDHGARLTNYTEPDGKERHWFSKPNQGSPFDETVAHEVMEAIRVDSRYPEGEE